MAIFFSLLITAFSCVFYGVIATVAIMAVLYAFLKGIERSVVRSIPFYITGVFLFVLLSIQISLLVGAVEIKSNMQAVEIRISQIVEGVDGNISANESQQLLDQLNEEYPLMSLYIGTANFSGHDIQDIALVMCNTINDFLITYIWYRIGWIIGLILVACAVVLCFNSKNRTLVSTKKS